MRTRVAIVRCAFALGVGVVVGDPCAYADEVAVVLDTSASMRTNDPEHLSSLAVLVLADLLRAGEDELLVIPFDSAMQGSAHASRAPILRWSAAASGSSFRDELQRTLVFDGQSTYFAPGLSAAVSAFSAGDQPRAVILLTDGASNDPVGDAKRINAEVIPAARTKGASVWVVALGKEAERSTLTRHFETQRIGGWVRATTARDLVSAFARVLGDAFRRQVEVRSVSAGGKLSIDSRPAVSQLEVVAIGDGPLDVGAVKLLPPSKTAWVPAPGDEVAGLVMLPSGASRGWRRFRLVTPEVGAWTLRSTSPVEVLIVRRYRYEVELSARGGHQAVPAGASLCLDARVNSRASPGSAAAPVTDPLDLAGLELRLAEFDAAAPQTPLADPAPMRDDGVAPDDTVAGDGLFGFCHAARPSEAGVTVSARGFLSSGGIAGGQSNSVSFGVLPELAVVAVPGSLAFGASAALSTEAPSECARFTVAPPDSRLYAASVAVVIDLEHDEAGVWMPGPAGNGPLRNLTVTLDGVGLTDPANPLPRTVSWMPGDHEVCVGAGRRVAGGYGKLGVTIAPAEPAYAAFAVSTRLELGVTTANPGFLEAFGTALVVGAVVVGGGVAYRYGRPRPQLPKGLRVRQWRANGTSSGEPQVLLAAGHAAISLAEGAGGLQVGAGSSVLIWGKPVEIRSGTEGGWRELAGSANGVPVPAQVGVRYRVGGAAGAWHVELLAGGSA